MALPANSLFFEGNNRILVSTNAAYTEVDNLSAFIWFKGGPQGANRGLYGQYKGSGNNKKWMIFISSDKFVIWLSDDGSNIRKIYTSSVSITDYAWNLIGFTFEANTLKIFKNGVEDTTPTKVVDSTCNSLFAGASTELLIGALDSGAPSNHIIGAISSQAMLINKTLSLAEIAEIYASGLSEDVASLSFNASIVAAHCNLFADPTATDESNTGNDGALVNVTASIDILNHAPLNDYSTDPGIANVSSGTGYYIEGTSYTGALSVPTPATGTAGTVDISDIKEQIRYILDINNTTTSTLLDLSSSMSKRVLKVAKINPENIPLQATLFPAITIHATKKSIESSTIAKNQLLGKRKGVVNLAITGMVWNQNFINDSFDDPADKDLEYLMENIEYVLRGYHDLNSTVTWQIPNDVTYHNAPFDEQTHFRVGLLDIEITKYY